jgi:mono/diheme cytochrome c family protein
MLNYLQDHSMSRLIAIGAVLLVAVAYLAADDGQQAPPRPTAQIQPAVPSAPSSTSAPERATINRYCVTCHSNRLKTGDLTLEAVDLDKVGENAATWEKAVRKLRARAMPPAGRPRPDEAAYTALISYLETSLDRAAAANPNPGRSDTFHRLNRTEYQNAVRDLLAVEVDATSLLPTDDASHGFDNVNLGGLSPTLLDRYLSAARLISRTAVGSSVRGPGEYTVILPSDLTQDEQMDGLPFGTRGGTVFRYTFPVDGEYAFQVKLARNRDENLMGLNQPQQMEIAVDGRRIELFPIKPPKVPAVGGGQDQPITDEPPADAALKVRAPVAAGTHDVLVSFLKEPSVLSESQRQPSLADIGATTREYAAIFSISVSGPLGTSTTGQTASRRRLFVCQPAKPSLEPACAKTILTSLARRAFRRTVSPQEIQDLLGFYKQGRADGDGFEAGIENGVRAILSSPQFLFRVERDPVGVIPDSVYRIGDFELASRLSFFIWSSIPDDELLDLAARGRLKDPSILEQQVRRMLADPRSESLVTSFAEQWLYLRNLNAFSPDPRLFPDFDDNLRDSFRRETELFFASIKDEDRSVLDFLSANYTFVNERLAKHYGIPNVYGSHFRRITLPADSPRGGLLGQASILAVTSYANRTSPVQRGKWVLTNILGMPPSPPPPNVPPLKDNGAGGKVLSMRDRMVQHRANPVCASCHQLMDPIGLSTENFDAVGHWREKTEDGAAVDASGGLPDGRTFQGIAGLKSALLSRSDVFVSTFTERLMTYALGRGLESYDSPAVRQITRDAAAGDYHFSSIVLGIAKSVPFTMRKAASRAAVEESASR